MIVLSDTSCIARPRFDRRKKRSQRRDNASACLRSVMSVTIEKTMERLPSSVGRRDLDVADGAVGAAMAELEVLALLRMCRLQFEEQRLRDRVLMSRSASSSAFPWTSRRTSGGGNGVEDATALRVQDQHHRGLLLKMCA